MQRCPDDLSAISVCTSMHGIGERAAEYRGIARHDTERFEGVEPGMKVPASPGNGIPPLEERNHADVSEPQGCHEGFPRS